jgi:hypothetical protein
VTGFLATLLSIGVLAAFALLGGGLWLLIKRRDTRQGVLMLIAAVVLLVNVLMWSLPPPG